ncbi:MAG: Rpn family recombination-promoting nuclease/putative transposase [Clostridiales Family XIII bacterium]|jgi:hypothetical protein|nr:Rpn family recombination-promoting nuclease/putative transposase [Clostridiales Family XIII bacterium]
MGVNREYRNSVFVDFFSNKERLIETYNAIEGKNYPADTEVEINTLEKVLFINKINDISFILDGKIVVLIEHQSTISENLPLRLLIYISAIYEIIIQKYSIYRRKRIELPRPEFIVLYNGRDEYPDTNTLRLSDAFKDAETLE